MKILTEIKLSLEDETFLLAEKLMREHGLLDDGWTFGFDNSKRRMGVCFGYRKKIKLSKWLLPYARPEKVRDTILHEIAHALVGVGRGHDKVWRAKAIEIGANGNRCYNPHKELDMESVLRKSKYTLTCPTCGKAHAGHRKPRKDTACRSCCGSVWKKEHVFKVTKNY